MNKILEYLLDLYEIELHKKSLYSDGVLSDKPKPGREKEFEMTLENISILEELIREQEEKQNG